jgi:ketosteroid isomerase-like protein
MSKILTFIFLLINLSFVSAQISVPGMPLEVAETMTSQQEAWNNGDIDAFMVGYWESDSLLFIGSGGVASGFTQTLENYKKSYPNKDAMGTLNFSNRSWTPISDSAALLIGSWRLSEEAKGMYSLIWKKIEGSWVIVADHSSN